jgi:serine O-acetyltransferase
MSRLTDDVRADYLRYRPLGSGSMTQILELCLHRPGMVACVILRVQEMFFRNRWGRAASICRAVNLAITGADFVPGCVVGPGVRLEHPSGIVVGFDAVVGSNCTILQQVTLGVLYGDREEQATPVLEDDVVVGAGARILGGVRIGRGASIGANAVVLIDVPAGATAVGIPARVLSEKPAEN